MMEAMTKSWTDERLEERFDAIDRRFDAVDQRFAEVDRRFDAVDQRFDRIEGEIRDLRLEMKAGFDRVDERFEAMHRLMVQGGIVIIAALLGLIGTQL
jgi:DNA anti-recombination protein RmuC